MYETINQSIQRAKKAAKFIEKDSPSFIEKTDMDPWDIETHVDISKGISPQDMLNIMSMKRVINSYFYNLYWNYIAFYYFNKNLNFNIFELKKYFSILKKSFKANIPKLIVKFLLKSTEERMKIEMQMALTKNKDPMSLIVEDPDIRKKREISQNNIKQLKIAMRSLKLIKRGIEAEA